MNNIYSYGKLVDPVHTEIRKKNVKPEFEN